MLVQHGVGNYSLRSSSVGWIKMSMGKCKFLSKCARFSLIFRYCTIFPKKCRGFLDFLLSYKIDQSYLQTVPNNDK